jgi:predicted amidohydrolase
VVSGLSFKLGFQVCSDVNRTTGFQLLSAMGAELVLVPRCTPPETYDRWKLVLRANAVTSGCYVVSSNRPAPTAEGMIGGPSIAIGPSGDVLLETTDRIGVVTLSRDMLEEARAAYPGYLKNFPGLYARGWEALESGE